MPSHPARDNCYMFSSRLAPAPFSCRSPNRIFFFLRCWFCLFFFFTPRLHTHLHIVWEGASESERVTQQHHDTIDRLVIDSHVSSTFTWLRRVYQKWAFFFKERKQVASYSFCLYLRFFFCFKHGSDNSEDPKTMPSPHLEQSSEFSHLKKQTLLIQAKALTRRRWKTERNQKDRSP